jgi:hypothetical protein
VKEQAYKALVRPHLEYASTVWDPTAQKHINDIEAVQHRASRFVASDYRSTTSVTAILDQRKWPSLQKRRTLQTGGALNFITAPPHCGAPVKTYNLI